AAARSPMSTAQRGFAGAVLALLMTRIKRRFPRSKRLGAQWCRRPSRIPQPEATNFQLAGPHAYRCLKTGARRGVMSSRKRPEHAGRLALVPVRPEAISEAARVLTKGRVGKGSCCAGGRHHCLEWQAALTRLEAA